MSPAQNIASLNSALSWIAQEYLYLFPAHAADIVAAWNLKTPQGLKEGEWLRRIIHFSANELIEWTSRDGDEEDKMIFMDVFLWKQRHGLIDPSLRIAYLFHEQSYAWLLNRYMVANGYLDVLDQPQIEGETIGYLAQIELLLDRFNHSDFTAEDLWSLLIQLNVLGSQIDQYGRRSEVLKVAEQVMQDAPVQLAPLNDVELARVSLLMLDLKLAPDKTWPRFRELFLSTSHSVACYPTLIAGLQMYGDVFLKEIQGIEIQGGNDLFFELMG